MLTSFRIIAFGFLCTGAVLAIAQPGAMFVANHGQWPGPVTYRAEYPGTFLWVEEASFVIDRYDAEVVAKAHGNIHFDLSNEDHEFLRHHAVRLRFLSATEDCRVVAQRTTRERYSFFLGKNADAWAGDVPAFEELSISHVAPGVDAILRKGPTGLKYDLVVAPGADPKNIRIGFEGADRVQLKDDMLIVHTTLGRITERIPLAYQEMDGVQRTIECSYTLRDGVIGFRPGTYDPSLPLVIDPTLSFATFSGSVSNNFGYTATFDNAGFLYAGSTAFGNQYPVTMGAYQTAWAGGTTDIAITKYDTTGTFLVWSTYLGGSAAEMPHSLIVDGNDQLHVLGTTGSDDFPVTTNAFDNSFDGGTPFTPAGLGLSYPNGSDMIIAKLSANGSILLGSTYLGGSSNDGLNSATGLKFNYADEVRGEVLLDIMGNIIITSCTQSNSMPVSAGAAQPIFGGGSHDGYVARFDPALSQLTYGSYVGGASADAVYAGELDEQGRLFVCGGTSSLDLPSSIGAVQPSFSGGTADAFVARFATDWSTIDALSYWGSSAYDQAYFVELDGPGSVYLFGQTSAPSGQLIFNAPYNLPGGGQFITKFSHDLNTLELSSRVGSGDGNPDISPTAFLVDVCNKIYTSGWGSSAGGLGGQLTTAGLPVTPDAHQSSTDGHDLYLAVFDIDMMDLSYATYYGGPVSPEHVDGGTSRFDRRGRVYQSVCAGCQGNSDFPTTPGAWSSTNNSGGCNNGLLKFDFDAPLVIAAFSSPDTVCGGATVTFTNLSSGASGYDWNFGDNNTSNAFAPTHSYGSPGTYTVTLTAMNPLTCNEEDIAVGQVFIDLPAPVVVAMNDTLLCGPITGLSVSANSFGSADRFLWSSSAAFTDTLNNYPNDSTALLPPVSGTYFVQAANASSCTAMDSVTVLVSNASIAVSGDTLICLNDTARLVLIGSDPGSTITWLPDASILSGQGTPQALASPTETTGFGVEVISPTGCFWSGVVTVTVSQIIGSSVQAFVDQNLVVPGTVVQLSSTPTSGVTYSWEPAGMVSDPNSPSPTATVTQTTTFILTVSDGICTKSDEVTVTVHDLICEEPDIFIPNSFTPNGDGANDVLFVRGRHISDLEFMIFDRWGEKVFETMNKDIGWDGSFKGEPLDPAVFVYHLTAYCVDGQRYFTKGNVSLLR